MLKRLLAAVGAATLVVVGSLPAPAATTGTFDLQVIAGPYASITVSTVGGASIVCDTGSSVSGVIACTNTVNVIGLLRSRGSGNGTFTVTAPAGTISGSGGSTLNVSALKMTCADNGSIGALHGTPTWASAQASSTTPVQCVQWPGPNAFAPNVNITYGIDAAEAPADTYPLSTGWVVTASST